MLKQLIKRRSTHETSIVQDKPWQTENIAGCKQVLEISPCSSHQQDSALLLFREASGTFALISHLILFGPSSWLLGNKACSPSSSWLCYQGARGQCICHGFDSHSIKRYPLEMFCTYVPSASECFPFLVMAINRAAGERPMNQITGLWKGQSGRLYYLSLEYMRH